MNCKRLVRVLPVFALTASLSYAAFFAKDVTLTFQGHDMVLTDVDGAWLSHEVAHTVQQGSGTQKKHIGNPKYEECRVAMRVGQFDPIMLDMLNRALNGELNGKDAMSLSGPNGMDLTFYGVRPHKVVTPGFDGDTCTDWEFAFGFTSGNGYPGQYKMKAKEKANRTKCSSNLRLIVNDGGKPRMFDVSESEPVYTIILEADLDGDGEFEAMNADVGNVVVYLPAVQSGYFEAWLNDSVKNPLFEENFKDGALQVRTDKFGSMEFAYEDLQPIAVTKMADGSVRVEFCTAKEQLKAKPRN